MLLYMFNEILTTRKETIDSLYNMLESYSGDSFEWYGSLPNTPENWRSSFFTKYLSMDYYKCMRHLFGYIGESQILSKIAYTLKIDQNEFAENSEARECALDLLASYLGRLENYKGSIPLPTYIYNQIPNIFRDQGNMIKAFMDQSFMVVDSSKEVDNNTLDLNLLNSKDSNYVYKLFNSLISVDEIFTISNQPSNVRQYSFLTAYQLWCFSEKVDKLNEISSRITFTVNNFNRQIDNREHKFVTDLFHKVLPFVVKMQGTADIKPLIRTVAGGLLDVQYNTGINVPITFSESPFNGEWFNDILHGNLVTKTKRDNFGLLIHAFIALGRLHNLLKSANVEFPSFHTNLSQDPHYMPKFKTLADFLLYSHKVIREIESNGLPVGTSTFLKPTDFSSSAAVKQLDSSTYELMFTILTTYNEFINTIINTDEPPEYWVSLRNAYSYLADGVNPLYLFYPDEFPKQLMFTSHEKFVEVCGTSFNNSLLSDNLSFFYERKARTTILPSFVKLINSIVDIYKYLKQLLGKTQTPTNRTGTHVGITVSTPEFAIILIEHPCMQKLSQLQIDYSIINSNENLIKLITTFLDNEEEAVRLVSFLADAPPEFYPHWSHVHQVLIYLYYASHESDDTLFGFEKSDISPPYVPTDQMARFHNQVEVKLTPQQKHTIKATVDRSMYKKDMYGFLMTDSGMYATELYAGDVYFKHSDGYSVNSKLEIKIWGGI